MGRVGRFADRLDARGVEHDANARGKGLGRDVVSELGTDNTRVAVRAGDAAPDDADLGATDLLGGLVDVGDTLAEVELGLVGLLNTLNLDEGGVALGDALRALVAHDPSLDVKTRLYRDKHDGGRVSKGVHKVMSQKKALSNADLSLHRQRSGDGYIRMRVR